MFFVIAQKQHRAGDKVQAGEFDYENPLGTYDDLPGAVLHAQAHTQNNGVVAIVVHESDLEALQKVDQKPIKALGKLSTDGVLKAKVVRDELPSINVWNTTGGKSN